MMMLFYIGYKVSNLLYRAVEDECFFYPHLDKNNPRQKRMLLSGAGNSLVRVLLVGVSYQTHCRSKVAIVPIL